MTPTEYRMLNDFLTQLRQVQGVQKDSEAAALIAEAATAQPDALYLLVQRALLQDQALASASARIAVLEAQAIPVAAAAPSSFLDGGNNAWGRSIPPASARAYSPSMGQPVAPAPASAPAAPATLPSTPVADAVRPGFLGGGGGNFLGTMAATAAGVAGGAFLFQGISNMMGHHGAAAAQPQSNAFSSMADSVDQTPATVSTAPVASTVASDERVAEVDNSSEDVDFGDDDAMA